MHYSYLILSASLLALTAHGKWSFGWCPTTSLEADFDKNQYIGTWYEIARDSNIVFEYGDCVQARYSVLDDGKIRVFNTQLNPYTNQIDSAEATAKFNGAKGKVKFFLTYSGDYRVVDTDYTTYSIVYSCTNFLFFKNEYVWILGRTETLDASTLTTL